MKRNPVLLLVAATSVACSLVTGCGGSGTDDVSSDATGQSLVMGTVQSFDAAAAGARLSGAVANTSVRLEGAVGRGATIDRDDGAFLLVAVPAGEYRLLIASGGVVATYEPLVVDAGVLVDLGSIRVGADGAVVIESPKVSPVLTLDQPVSGGSASVNVQGTWVGAEGDGEMFALTLKEANGAVVGIMANSDSDARVSGSISGDTLILVADYRNGAIDDWRGTVSGNRMSGTWTSNEGDSGIWSATRQ